MTISYPLAYPDERKVSLVTMRQVDVVGQEVSPFTGMASANEFAGQWWEADITLPPMPGSQASTWIGWIAALRGKLGTFLLGDPRYTGPSGSARTTPGTPLVNGASQTGNTLAIDGCPASATGYLLRGDMIGLGSGATSRMHVLMADANTNGSGQVTLDIWPRLRVSPADNSAIELTSPKTRFGLADNVRSYTFEPALIMQPMQLSVRERLDGS